MDWVALVDKLWASDDESSSEHVRKEKTSFPGRKQENNDEGSSKFSSHHEEQFQLGEISKMVDHTSCLSEDPLSCENNVSHTSSSSPHSSPHALQSSHKTPKIRQTDLLSYIDHKYSQKNSTAPLADVKNLQCSSSTDDGYMTWDSSRSEYTPQLSLPDVEKKTKLSRALFLHKTTRR